MAKTLDKNQIGALMGCKPASAVARLVALGYSEVCTRCGGSGRYSWNQINGDICFGCNGARKMLAKITPAIVSEALVRIEAGELAGYFAEIKARKEIKAANDALWAAYKATAIAAAYTEGSKASSRRALERCRAGLDPDNGAFLETPVFRAQSLNNRIMDRATAALYDRTGMAHTARIAIIREAHAMVLQLDAAWSAFAAR